VAELCENGFHKFFRHGKVGNSGMFRLRCLIIFQSGKAVFDIKCMFFLQLIFEIFPLL
jgi:hypothetical protein